MERSVKLMLLFLMLLPTASALTTWTSDEEITVSFRCSNDSLRINTSNSVFADSSPRPDPFEGNAKMTITKTFFNVTENAIDTQSLITRIDSKKDELSVQINQKKDEVVSEMNQILKDSLLPQAGESENKSVKIAFCEGEIKLKEQQVNDKQQEITNLNKQLEESKDSKKDMLILVFILAFLVIGVLVFYFSDGGRAFGGMFGG